MNYCFEIDPLLINNIVQIPYEFSSRLIINKIDKYEEHIFMNKIIYHDDNKLYYHIDYKLNGDYNNNNDNNTNNLIQVNIKDFLTDDLKAYFINSEILNDNYKYYILENVENSENVGKINKENINVESNYDDDTFVNKRRKY